MTGKGEQRNHVADLAMGGSLPKSPGKARYSRQLIVLPDGWEPMPGVPASRSRCPKERPCPYVRCEWNLWMIDRRDRVGTRRPGQELPSSIVVAHCTQNCGADLAERVKSGRMTVAELADAVGISERQLRRIVERAKRKLAANDESAEAAHELLDQMGEK